MAKPYDRSGDKNPNWKGGITKMKCADDWFGLPVSAQREVQRRLLSRFKKSDEGCWNWTGSVFASTGRARMFDLLAYRLAFVVFKRKIIGDLCVCHSCDNPLCIRPSHLWLGTFKDNSEDSVRKDRQATGDRNGSRLHPEKLMRGEDVGLAKLTEEAVVFLREALKSKTMKVKQLALRFGVTNCTIRKANRRDTWRHVI